MFSLLYYHFFVPNNNFTKQKDIYKYIWIYFVHNYIYLYVFMYIFTYILTQKLFTSKCFIVYKTHF